MPHFFLSVRLLDDTFHGEGAGGRPEWPPTPLRVFQALVAAAARLDGDEIPGTAKAALMWLERRPEAPVVIAATGVKGAGYRLSVPNNSMDVVATAWARGNESNSGDANPSTHRTMKAVRPVLLPEESAVHYVWRLPEPLDKGVCGHVKVLGEIARRIAAVGWGMDLAIGHSGLLLEQEVESLPGERWLPVGSVNENGLRVPVAGTFEDLVQRHERFLRRIGPQGFDPPPPLSAYRIAGYRNATEPEARPFAAFSLLRPDGSDFRPFDTARSGLTVAGMMRSAVRATAEQSGWPLAKISSFVLGHGEAGMGDQHVAVGPHRFAYLPLPSMELRRTNRMVTAGSIRRVMLMADSRGGGEIAWATRMISGQEIRYVTRPQAVAVLSMIPASDRMVQRYTRRAAEWATVTPVVLPGHDDPRHYRRRMEAPLDADEQKDLLARLDARIDSLIRKAMLQAGYSRLLADCAGTGLVQNRILAWLRAGRSLWGSGPSETLSALSREAAVA